VPSGGQLHVNAIGNLAYLGKASCFAFVKTQNQKTTATKTHNDFNIFSGR
jgi:hypothetical protein